MRFANISLLTFDKTIPSRTQLLKRMVAMLISALTLGVGVLWAIFDEQHLCLHDRLSHTYLLQNK
jgi:hypothetical protein